MSIPVMLLSPRLKTFCAKLWFPISKDQLGWDATEIAAAQPKRPIVDILSSVAGDSFSKYQLAKAFIRWSRDHSLDDLADTEIAQAEKLVAKINKALA